MMLQRQFDKFSFHFFICRGIVTGEPQDRKGAGRRHGQRTTKITPPQEALSLMPSAKDPIHLAELEKTFVIDNFEFGSDVWTRY
jgi:hypothetical protein